MVLNFKQDAQQFLTDSGWPLSWELLLKDATFRIVLGGKLEDILKPNPKMEPSTFDEWFSCRANANFEWFPVLSQLWRSSRAPGQSAHGYADSRTSCERPAPVTSRGLSHLCPMRWNAQDGYAKT